jgi:anti-sigma factor RsiW
MTFTDAHVGDLAAALVDDQLDQSTRDQVLLHLGRCPGCRSDVDEQRQLKMRLLSLGTPGLPSGLMARLGALSPPELPDFYEEPVTFLGAHPPESRRPSLLRNPQRGRRMLVGAASLLLVGAGTAVAAGGDGQPGGPLTPSSSTFSTSFSSPIGGAASESRGSALPVTDPAFGAVTASFNR